MKDLMSPRVILYVAFIAIVSVGLYNHFMKKPATAAAANGASTTEESAG